MQVLQAPVVVSKGKQMICPTASPKRTKCVRRSRANATRQTSSQPKKRTATQARSMTTRTTKKKRSGSQYPSKLGTDLVLQSRIITANSQPTKTRTPSLKQDSLAKQPTHCSTQGPSPSSALFLSNSSLASACLPVAPGNSSTSSFLSISSLASACLPVAPGNFSTHAFLSNASLASACLPVAPANLSTQSIQLGTTTQIFQQALISKVSSNTTTTLSIPNSISSSSTSCSNSSAYLTGFQPLLIDPMSYISEVFDNVFASHVIAQSPLLKQIRGILIKKLLFDHANTELLARSISTFEELYDFILEILRRGNLLT